MKVVANWSKSTWTGLGSGRVGESGVFLRNGGKDSEKVNGVHENWRSFVDDWQRLRKLPREERGRAKSSKSVDLFVARDSFGCTMKWGERYWVVACRHQSGSDVCCDQCTDWVCTAFCTAGDGAANYYACTRKMFRMKIYGNTFLAFLDEGWASWVWSR